VHAPWFHTLFDQERVMARRHWTLMLISEGENGVRQFRFTREAARAGVAAALLLVAALSSAATRAVGEGSEAVRELSLARRNALLEAEIEDLRSRLDTLRSSVETLAAKDDYYRLIAGLDPLDADVRRVGIGGPGTETLQTNALFPVDRRLARKLFSTSTEVNTLIRRARLLSFSWRQAEDTLIVKHDRLASTPSITPTDGAVSSAFSYRRWHPLLGLPRPHLGVDIVALPGTPIVAAAKGRVTFVGNRGEYGNLVVVDHGYGYVTRYAHASRILVKLGQPVQRGDMIALVGSTGLAMGPHVHYEVLVDGRHVNPRRFMLDASVVPE
jgi:murein DD-endopeptidase MepM/ murein hydrolase activator NlpD